MLETTKQGFLWTTISLRESPGIRSHLNSSSGNLSKKPKKKSPSRLLRDEKRNKAYLSRKAGSCDKDTVDTATESSTTARFSSISAPVMSTTANNPSVSITETSTTTPTTTQRRTATAGRRRGLEGSWQPGVGGEQSPILQLENSWQPAVGGEQSPILQLENSWQPAVGGEQSPIPQLDGPPDEVPDSKEEIEVKTAVKYCEHRVNVYHETDRKNGKRCYSCKGELLDTNTISCRTCKCKEQFCMTCK